MQPSDDLAVSGASGADQDHQDVRNFVGDRFLPHRTQGAYQHPKIRSLVAKHCEQLSSELVDIFRTDVEREVKQRVSEVIVSEATVFCEQLKSKDDALLAAEVRCKDLREQLELSNQMCCKLQERVKQLEATEAELRITLDNGLEEHLPGMNPPPLESRHLTVIYERRDNRTLCRLCVDGHSRDESLPVIPFKVDVKPSTLAWHIQRQHPQEYNMLLGMNEEELGEVAKEMGRVGGLNC